MENNALQADYNEWVAGKDYPSFMDEISFPKPGFGIQIFRLISFQS